MVTQEQRQDIIEAGQADVGKRLDRWLSERLPDMSRSRVQALIRRGGVVADGAALCCSGRVVPGMRVAVTIPEAQPVGTVAEAIPLDIVFEDSDVVVVNKPPGFVVHPAPGHSDGTLVNALLHHCKDLAGVGDELRPGIVHRLDRDTSGLIIVAKNEKAMLSLSRQFHEREVQKQYVALVHGSPGGMAGRIETEIGRSHHDRKKMSTRPSSGGRHALTFYEVAERFQSASLVRVRIETGRTHQIRVHMAHLRCPVVGDIQYGSPKLDKLLPLFPVRQMLHAEALSFDHPVTRERMTLTAAWPTDFDGMVESLRASSTGPT